MREPIRAKLEEYDARLGQANARLSTLRRDLREAEVEMDKSTVGLEPILLGMLLAIIILFLTISTGSVIFGFIFFIAFFIWVIYPTTDVEAVQAKINSIKSNIGNINSEIETIKSSIGNTNAAMEAEENLDYQRAIDLFDQVGLSSEAKGIRTKMQKEGKVQVSQKVVHGDEVTKTEIKDSVLNRSNVGGGKSSKAKEIKEIKELLDSGAIDDDEFKQMKKEILGK